MMKSRWMYSKVRLMSQYLSRGIGYKVKLINLHMGNQWKATTIWHRMLATDELVFEINKEFNDLPVGDGKGEQRAYMEVFIISFALKV